MNYPYMKQRCCCPLVHRHRYFCPDFVFCRHHGASRPANPPSDLTCVAEKLIPRIILRLLQHLRVNIVPPEVVNTAWVGQSNSVSASVPPAPAAPLPGAAGAVGGGANNNSGASTASNNLKRYEFVIQQADRFLKLLHDLSSLGAAMRSVMTK